MGARYRLDTEGRRVVEWRSERLVGTPVALGDAAFLDQLHADPVVMATLGGVRDDDASADWLAANVEHWQRHDFGYWTLRSTDGTPLGRGGLRWLNGDFGSQLGQKIVEVGYTIRRAAWNKGYATEATLAFIAIAENHHGLDQLGAIALETNEASARVLSKAGFQFERVVEHPIGPHRFFRLQLSPGT